MKKIAIFKKTQKNRGVDNQNNKNCVTQNFKKFLPESQS